jgi:nucleoside phosphorylase
VRYQRFGLGAPSLRAVTVTLVCMQEAGNLLAANVVRDYVGAFGRPDLAVLCGMAMGTTKDVTSGDVVISKQVFDYGPRRVTLDEERSRFESYRVRATLLHDLRNHRNSHDDAVQATFRESVRRLDTADVHVPSEVRAGTFTPRFHAGVILSGDELVEDESGAERARAHDRAYALEMEGAGFCATCDHLGSDWFVIRGVADHGEANRDKSWQAAATAAAASFVRTFLLSSWQPLTEASSGSS